MNPRILESLNPLLQLNWRRAIFQSCWKWMMNTKEQFIYQISRIKKQVRLQTGYQFMLLSLLIGLSGLALAGILSKTGVFEVYPRKAYWVFIAGSLGVSAVVVGWRRKRFGRILIEIDRRQNLKDRISTAYEYFIHGKMANTLVGKPDPPSGFGNDTTTHWPEKYEDIESRSSSSMGMPSMCRSWLCSICSPSRARHRSMKKRTRGEVSCSS